MKQAPRARFEVFGRAQPEDGAAAPAATCAWPGCGESGTHRAPKSRSELARYTWFCLEHVRIYNSSWNYYIGMSEAEVEACIRSDTTWNRPSWPIGGGPLGGGCGPDGLERPGTCGFDALDDPFGLFGAGLPGRRRRAVPHAPHLTAPERRAFGVLGLEYPVTFEELKARYKVLVKRHHPDANGGAKDAEERLKRINEAFETLKNGLFA